MASMPLYRTDALRRVEAAAQARHPSPSLMERAGLATAEHARRIMGERGGPVLVVAGPGNNGGDAFEAAVRLKEWFYKVDVLFIGDASRLPADAARAFARWQNAPGTLLGEWPSEVRRHALVIDGLFGIGLARTPEGRFAECIARMNSCGVPVLAIDVPSGLDADTGATRGSAVHASHTVTFIAMKPGLMTLDGPDFSGEVTLDTLGVDAEGLCPPEGRLTSAESLRRALTPRARNFHKGMAGDVVVVGGAAGMVGAALLAGRAALACGAGRVHVALLDADAPRVDVLQPELMLRTAAHLPANAVLAAGPGLGRSDEAAELLTRILEIDAPLVLDADALNLVATKAPLAMMLKARSAPTLLTPHPAEAGRLLQAETTQVQADRVASARMLAERYGACVALKGNGTVVAFPDGEWWINGSGHPGMASAGMGDALTGIVAALLSQRADARNALIGAVWLHGAAGDAAARESGSIGTTATEVIRHARRVLNETIG